MDPSPVTASSLSFSAYAMHVLSSLAKQAWYPKWLSMLTPGNCGIRNVCKVLTTLGSGRNYLVTRCTNVKNNQRPTMLTLYIRALPRNLRKMAYILLGLLV